MQIGELAAASGIPAQTIRFYERRGLLPEPERQPNGYRRYGRSAVDRIAFIRRAQGAGLTLTEIRGVLDVRAEGEVPCEHVTQLLADKLEAVDDQLRELQTLQGELHALIERSRELDPADCTDGEVCHVLGTARAT